MKKLLLNILLLTITSTIALAQEPALIDFGDEKVSPDEFKRVYLKNNSGDMVEKSSVEEYLDLYINFKLKVKEAEAKGLDTNQLFINELEGYRKQLAQPYLTAEGMIEDLKKEAYDRLKEEVSVSHILIASSSTDAPEDTLAAYKKAMKVKKRADRGDDFNSLAMEYSDDPSVKNNKGELGYFTAFYMVYPFESAAYETEVGEISDIAKTRFGYHILKVNDRRPNSGEITVRHILISSDPEISKIADPKAKIDEIYAQIQEGETLETMARKYSDDTKSAANGGILPIFGVGKMVKPFEDVAFALKKDGEISEPFETQFGWHIVQRVKKDEVGTYDEIEPVIDNKVRKDSRSKLSQSAVIKKIKSQYGFEEKSGTKEDFYNAVDSAYYGNVWNPAKADGLDKVMFTIGDQEYTQEDFTDYLMDTQKGSRKMDIRVLVNQRYDSFKEKMLLNYKDQQLEKEYPEFKALIEEYHDGILLFNLTDDLVWSKASKDTAGLEAFYEKNKEDYRWEERLDAVIYTLKDQAVADQVKSMIAKGLEPDSIMKLVNESSQLNLRYEKKKYEMEDHPILKEVKWKKGNVQEFPKNNRLLLVQVRDVLKPDYKQLNEARGLIISDYQEQLEKEWIESLREKYSFEVNEELLKILKTELN